MGYIFSFQLEPLTKKWWKHLLLGILFVFLAVWMFIAPLTSYMSLSLFFTLALAVTGVFDILAALLYKKEIEHWMLHLTGGAFELLVGLLFLFNPVMTMNLLPYLLAFWLLFKGGRAIWISVRLKIYEVKGWGWMFASGSGILICSILIMVYPVIGGFSIVFATALAFLALGLFNFLIAYFLGLGRLRKR